MIHTEGVTMKHPHFRLKIDLSKFFHDARQLCWIFIDGIKIQQIFHIQQHISKLFSITEPFHLLLNTEYLPPTEDVRILKENETIQVVPGSGIKNEVDKAETCNGSMHDKQVHTIDMKTRVTASDTLDGSNNTLNDTQPTSINNTAGNMTFYSVIDDTAIDDTEEDTDSKITDNNLTEDCNVTNSVISIPKRKRVRRRRPKNQSKTEFTLSFNMNEENKPKKPKIIDSYIIPSGKHIRFDNVEKEENNIAKQIVQEISRNESSISKNSSPRDLCTLLALGQSSTPITFVHKKVKNEIKVENELNDGIKNKTLNKNENNISTEKNLNNKETTQCYENWIHSDPEIIPIMTRKPQVKDIIAFKTLKMGADYTPQLSNFIVTEVVDFCAHSANYYLKIIKGKEEVQVPFGKFSLSEDTSANPCDTDTFLLKSSQICEPRLLASFSKSSVL